MNWFYNLVKTYDNVSQTAGIPDNKGNVLLPPNCMTKKTDIKVIIDGEGRFRDAENKNEEIVILCTEESQNRTSGICPHPLHEELSYLCFEDNKKKAYFNQLEQWKDYHPKVKAVYVYLNNNTLLDDLRSRNITVDIAELSPYKKDGGRKSEKELQDEIYKQFVCFSVEIPGDFTPNLWEDLPVTEAWQKFLNDNFSMINNLCYVTGEMEPIATLHPKGINTFTNGAKLISCNDYQNYTFRGRFTKPEQANSISAVASQKAHAMLKYLITTQGYKCDTQAIVAWAVDTGEAALDPFASSDELYGLVESERQQTETELVTKAKGILAIDYAKKLKNALEGFGDAEKLRSTTRHIAVIAEDAITKNSGRMSITFYQDLPENQYIDSIIIWHNECCWWFRENNKEFISAPSADKIIEVVYGELKGESYIKVKKQARQRILHNIVCGEHMDYGWVNAAVNRVSNPLSFTKKDGGWDKPEWDKAISIACAIVRKYYIDKKEEIPLELDELKDRSFLYGRLIAIADRIETHARYLQCGKDDQNKTSTNAIRYMPAFTAKPFSTWNIIYKQLNPYIQRLNGAEGYQRLIDDILSKFTYEEYISDKSLDGKYLLGYSLQRREFNKNNDQEEKK
ncbi:MAG: type I-C CRISPR-associated protein Cas8c/Csd1 [Clostridiales bacterium]|jgi:CRISPR-associated protein Csd1|nr:type I-C CRISPR-associated protein Cas8c/Csd1 [Clostridiales bacterium]